MLNRCKLISVLFVLTVLLSPLSSVRAQVPPQPPATAPGGESTASPPAAAPAATPAQQVIRNFSFLHTSDSHVEAYLSMPSDSSLEGARSYKGVQTLRSIGEVMLAPYGITAPKPSFILHTGDIAEFSMPAVTWDVIGKYYHLLGLPIAYAAGNHDNTWVATPNRWRALFGGTNYSFDAADCHFILLNSATLQDPRPSFGEEVLTFLRKDLAKVPPTNPVFVGFHHPPNTREFASRYDIDRVLDVLRPYNLVLMLYGHGHSANHMEFGGVDFIQGGSPYDKNSKAERIGHMVVYAAGNQLFAAYKRTDETSASKPILAKAIPPRSLYPTITITSPTPFQQVSDDSLTLEATIDAGTQPITGASYDLDDEEALQGKLVLAASRVTAKIDTRNLANGGHFLRVNFQGPGKKVYYKTVAFYVERRAPGQSATAKWRFHMDGGSQCMPLVHNGRVYAGANDGYLYALDEQSGQLLWKVNAGGEIIGTPAVYNNTLLFGTGSGNFFAVTPEGKAKWSFAAGDPVFSPPVVDEEGNVFFGTNGAKLIALKADSGQLLWKNEGASYGIESRPCVTAERVYFGAWDGQLHCVDKKNARTLWKKSGPKNQPSSTNRYYAPADNGPLVAGDQVFVTDRGYVAGSYRPDGSYVKNLSTACSALALASDGKSLYVRSTNKPLSRVDLSGKTIWNSSAPGGSLPFSPTEADGVVYTCSNTGQLSAVDAASGQLKWQYQVTPSLYVMSGVAASNGVAFTTSMDGFVTAVQPLAGTAR